MFYFSFSLVYRVVVIGSGFNLGYVRIALVGYHHGIDDEVWLLAGRELVHDYI